MMTAQIHSCPELMDYIQQVGFLPLLDSGIPGYSAEELVDADCRYVVLPDGGWDWPLWKWKGPIVTEDFSIPSTSTTANTVGVGRSSRCPSDC